MRFVVDAQLPPALARWIVNQGHEATHVAERGLVSASDRVIWDHAWAVGAVIVTKDEDFARRRVLVVDGPPIVWLRIGNTRRRALLGWFSRGFPDLLSALERGEPVVEVR